MLPKPSLQFSEEEEAKLLEGRAPVCYFCKGDTDDAQSEEGVFVRVREISLIRSCRDVFSFIKIRPHTALCCPSAIQ